MHWPRRLGTLPPPLALLAVLLLAARRAAAQGKCFTVRPTELGVWQVPSLSRSTAFRSIQLWAALELRCVLEVPWGTGTWHLAKVVSAVKKCRRTWGSLSVMLVLCLSLGS